MKLFFRMISLCFFSCQIPSFTFSLNCNHFSASQDGFSECQPIWKRGFGFKFQRIRGGALQGSRQSGKDNTENKLLQDILTPFFKRMNFENIITPRSRWPRSIDHTKIKDQASMSNNNFTVSSSEKYPLDSSQKEWGALRAQLKHLLKRFFECALLAVPIENFLWHLGLSSDRSLIHSMSQWVACGIYLMVITGVLGTVGFDTKPIVAGLGLTTFTIGFALKELVSNILAGALLVLQRPFRVGWTIKVNAFRGKVLAIDTRYVRLLSDEGQIILIPSYTVFSSPIIVEDIPGVSMKHKKREDSIQ